VTDLQGRRVLVFPVPRAAQGGVAVAELSARPAPRRRARLAAGPLLLENDTFRVRFDEHGNLRSLRWKEDGKEVIAEGELANLFQLFEDRPLAWSAWDLDIFSLESPRDLRESQRFELVERGPVRAAFELEKRFGRSRLLQRITPGLRFDTLVDWQEEERLLKVAFPLRLNVNRASFEIQFGHLERPTHRNTSWDLARFEVCAHRFVDLSEGDSGVALLNDSKYGHDVEGSRLRLSLLRAPRAPDPEADRGLHCFSYVLLPHRGDLRGGGVVAAAEALNSPLRVARLDGRRRRTAAGGAGPAGPDSGRFLAWNDPNLVLSAVKRAEDGTDLVVRFHEAHNCRGRARIACARKLRAAWRADLMERRLEEIPLEGGALVLDYQPFEIITLLLRPA
jgi:alpha-mannosidase